MIQIFWLANKIIWIYLLLKQNWFFLAIYNYRGGRDVELMIIIIIIGKMDIIAVGNKNLSIV